MEKDKQEFILDFLITQNCNYRCAYCSQSKKFVEGKLESADDSTLNSLLSFLDKNNEKFQFEITISGGEPLLHPKFFYLLEEIVKRNAKISIVSNFSFPIEAYKKIKDVSGDNLKELFISLHLTQVKDIDSFLKKAEIFNKYKGNSNFTIGAVLTDENCEKLKVISDYFNEREIKFELQHLRIKNSFVQYKNEAKEFISKFKISKIKEKSNTYGNLCSAGCNFMFIYQNGEAFRCYSSRFNRIHHLGNINNDKFKIYKRPIPCLNRNCTCPKPILYNLIDYNKKSRLKACFLSTYNALWLPYYFVKNFGIIKTKLIQAIRFKKQG